MTSHCDSPKLLTIVFPAYNEELVLPSFLKILEEQAESLSLRTNYIAINDGSIDQTEQILDDWVLSGQNRKVIHLSRNFGHQAAISAALDHADGDAVVILDSDLQDSPEIIKELLIQFESGAEVVYVVKTSRESSKVLKFCYKIFYKLLSRLSHITIPEDSGDFCLLSKRVVIALRSLKETHVFHRGLRSWVGFKQVAVTVNRPDRKLGKSKYNSAKLFKLAFDGILSFSIVPLRMFGVIGLVTLIFSFLFAAYSIYIKLFTNSSPTGFTAIICLITFLFGVQLMSTWILGEYIGRIFEESKKRPRYVIDRINSSPQ